jgi:endonuclease/exonuclease/phosphatase family metal-dependent hydrolase
VVATSAMRPAVKTVGSIGVASALLVAGIVAGSGATAAAPTGKVAVDRAGVGAANRSLASVTVGTFNTHGGSPGLPNSGARQDRVAAEISRGGYDVVGLQETNTDRRNGLQARLKATYAHSYLGDPRDKHATGGQIFYKRAAVYPGNTAGHFELSRSPANTRSALYQDFTQASTGVRFLFVSTHLYSGAGRAAADLRNAQTVDLLNGIESVNRERLPVVYVGDFNSHDGRKYVYDAPRLQFEARGMPDAIKRAGSVKYANYNTYNRLQKRIQKGGFRPDQIYTTTDIGVASWENMVRLKVKNKTIRKSNGKTRIKKIKRNQTPFASDHNAVRAVVVIPGR